MTNTTAPQVAEEFQRIFKFEPKNQEGFSVEENHKIEEILGLLTDAIRFSKSRPEIKKVENSHITIEGAFHLAISIAKMSGYAEKSISSNNYSSGKTFSETNGEFLKELREIYETCNEIIKNARNHH